MKDIEFLKKVEITAGPNAGTVKERVNNMHARKKIREKGMY